VSRSSSASRRLKGFHAPSSRSSSSFILAARATAASTMSWILYLLPVCQFLRLVLHGVLLGAVLCACSHAQSQSRPFL
jgi:hypothetical protein